VQSTFPDALEGLEAVSRVEGERLGLGVRDDADAPRGVSLHERQIENVPK
jgi:hypothetical protein